MKKFCRCYGCYAYESVESPGTNCLCGEGQNWQRNKYGMLIVFAIRPYCKVKSIKDLINRQEEWLQKRTIN